MERKIVSKKKNNSKIVFTKKTIDQFSSWIKKYKKIIQIAKDKWLNESDKSNVINDILNDVLWYEKMIDITTEYKIKSQFCDYGIKIDNRLSMLIEVKAIGIDLNENHIYQASSYASTEWVKRVVLTNLRERRLYHLSFWSRIDSDLVFSIDILNESKQKALEDSLLFIHKEWIYKWHIDKLRSNKTALSLDNIRKILLSKPMIKKIQLELAKTTKVKVPEWEIYSIIDRISKE